MYTQIKQTVSVGALAYAKLYAAGSVVVSAGYLVTIALFLIEMLIDAAGPRVANELYGILEPMVQAVQPVIVIYIFGLFWAIPSGFAFLAFMSEGIAPIVPVLFLVYWILMITGGIVLGIPVLIAIVLFSIQIVKRDRDFLRSRDFLRLSRLWPEAEKREKTLQDDLTELLHSRKRKA